MKTAVIHSVPGKIADLFHKLADAAFTKPKNTHIAVETAVFILRNAILYFPRNPELHKKLGEILSWDERDKEAEPYLRNVIALQPDNAKAQYELGICLLQQNLLQEAETYLQSAYFLAVKNRDNETYALLENAEKNLTALTQPEPPAIIL